ncbi:MAG: hemerythrin domain-containing protein [Nocardioidaceae bacterium]
MRNLFEVLSTAHREMEQMLGEFESLLGPGEQPTAELNRKGASLADTVITAASQHEAAEEQYFWPVVKDRLPNGDSLAAGGVEQESEAKKVLNKLDGMAANDGQFIPLLTSFVRDTREHIAYEEEQVWPGLRNVLSDEESDELGEKLAKAQENGPTRPHPHTPPNPALLKAAGPAVAAADRLRDSVTRRDN